jgi:HTH-type transcriptional regulator, transcriptional repressor of NAD biosynthesis genes
MMNGVKLVCFYGPESTGKSVMAVHMAERYKTEYVPEVAREMVSSNAFSADDIIAIGNAHIKRIREKALIANKVLFCDTDAITTQIYSQHYLATVPPVLYTLEKEIGYDRYFLFDIDVPWVGDGMRDLGHARPQMFQTFKHALEQRNIDYVLVTGNWLQREHIVTEAIDKLLA